MVMRAKKKFVVVAYDISDDKRRSHVVKILEKVGIRVNYSVFECMLTDVQYQKLQANLLSLIKIREDTIVYYPICIDCYGKIVYQSTAKHSYEKISII